MQDMENFDGLRIGIASPEKIREWSKGEVKKPETINYRTLKPERDGLFCEKIFGPTKDWECYCGKYKKVRYKGIICDRCGVEVTKKKVRRERMGHIELACPVSHIWFFKGIPGRMGLILDMSPKALEKVLYFVSYVVLDSKDTTYKPGDVLSEREYREAIEKYGSDSLRVGMGAEAIRELLQRVEFDKLQKELRKELEKATGAKRVKLIKRLETIDAFVSAGNRPEWMILEALPVIPPDLRPMVQLDGGRFATSDLNDLYRRVINRNNRLKRLLELEAPDIIVRNEKRMLQEAVDALIDNGRRGRPITGAGGRPLKSLSDMLKGKQGRFRQNLLGKRVDYSGRSVIVVGPSLKIHQCGLPREMALELFKPFVMKELVKRGIAFNIKNAKRMVERTDVEVWDVLEDVIKDRPVLLNRAPTLHRLGIQAFEPVLVEGRAIKLHPLVCSAFNADFDGDQMAVHVPLSPEAVAEAKLLMLASNNLLKLQDGKPVAVPSQDMILGSFYLTVELPEEEGNGKIFSNVDEAMMAYDQKVVGMHAPIKVRMSREVNGKKYTGLVDATVGRLIFNSYIPQDLGFVDRSNENYLELEIGFEVKKKQLGQIIDRCISKHGIPETAVVLDDIKENGYKYSTQAAVTVSVSDIEIPKSKPIILAEADQKIEGVIKNFKRGLISDDERYNEVIKIWSDATDKIQAAIMSNPDKMNPIQMMAYTGARGNPTQIRQLSGMRGLMANTSGQTIELPIKSNFKEGLDVLEFFIASHGARKGLADTALRTADSGYLTRRLVDVNQEIIVMEDDCGTHEGFEVEAIMESGEPIEKLHERIEGRFIAKDILDENGNVIYGYNTYVTPEIADDIVARGITKVTIRSALTCESIRGVCAKCYGKNMATGEQISTGEAIGIIAAQSIGEPGTQLTMRTIHNGGVAGSDITQGLPRVEELFEARKPKGVAMVTEIDGTVSIGEKGANKEVIVTREEDKYVEKYLIPFGMSLGVTEGQKVKAGDRITEGSLDPHDIIRIKGETAVENYLIDEVQKVYRTQGVNINDKHIEIVTRQMLRKIFIEDAGETNLIAGSTVDMTEYKQANKDAIAEGKKTATGKKILLGITKVALMTDSFLSAASFQETARVLTDAAVKGKVDKLLGLKENVIIGRLIPAGTGVVNPNNIEIVADDDKKDLEYSSIKEDLVEDIVE